MDSQADDLLDDLVMACLERVEAEGPSAVEAVCAEHPEQAEALRARMAALADAGLLGEPDAPPERLGEFRLGRRLGGGGMGVVYAAVQEPLEREVALKIVRADQLYFPGARERFRRELQLVARLAHAGIVPVYAGGEHEGVPYFAMERLQGATLAEALETLDGPPRTGRELADAVARIVEVRDGARVDVHGPLYEGDGVRCVVRIVRRVAQALAHAHGRGVLHRDLKPSNVMLTTDGRALLFDFGLASSADAVRLTQSGSRVGSLAYMSPEQVRGGEVDPRSDVYGLGALLCEALTAQPPHAGGVEAVGAAILRGDPVSLRARRRDVPRDVETVVQTALAYRPEHRYADAEAFARDLGHVLERRPIEARRAGPVLRALRWGQRHPARAALLALVVLVPAGFAVQQGVAARREASLRERADENARRVHEERARAQENLARAQENLARAEENLERALDNLDSLVQGLGQEFLEHAPGQQTQHVQLLEDALASLDSVIPQRPEDEHVRCRWVRVQTALAEIALERGDIDGAEARVEAAVEIAREHISDPLEHVPPLNALGNLALRRGRPGEAVEHFLAAAELADEGDGRQALHGATITLRNASRALVRVGRLEEARVVADASLERAERALALASETERRFDAEHDLGAALVWRSSIELDDRRLMNLGLPPLRGVPAAAAYERALPLLLGLVAQRPQRSDVTHEAAAACANAGGFLAPADAEVVVRRGLELSERLRRDFPERAIYAFTHMELLTNLGELVAHGGRQAEAHGFFEAAAAEAESWLARDPHNLDYQRYVADTGVNLAVSLIQLDRRAEACEPAARAVAHLESLLVHQPEMPVLVVSLHWARVQEAYGRIARGELVPALELARALPDDAHGHFVLAVSAGELLAGCAGLADDPAVVAALHAAALERLEQGVRLGFGQAEYLRSASEWAELREHPRFVQLLEQLEARRP